MTAYNWPGNIRELENVIERLVVINRSNVIDKKTVSMVVGIPDNDGYMSTEKTYNLKKATTNLECQIIKSALTEFRTKRKAAIALGIDHSTLVKKCQRYGIWFLNFHEKNEADFWHNKNRYTNIFCSYNGFIQSKYVTVQSQAKFQKTGIKCLHFYDCFWNFIWRIRHADEMRSILEVSSEQLPKYSFNRYQKLHLIKLDTFQIIRNIQMSLVI